MEIYDISSLKKINVPVSGVPCVIKGFFFYRMTDGKFPKCYLGDAPENPSAYITLEDRVGNIVLSDDETFGMLVGGEFAYFGLACIAEGVLFCNDYGFFLSMVSRIKITKDGIYQDFMIN